MRTRYTYHTAQGKANLYKEDWNNNQKVVHIGNFKTEAEAKQACLKHYDKACKALNNFDKPIPELFWA